MICLKVEYHNRILRCLFQTSVSTRITVKLNQFEINIQSPAPRLSPGQSPCTGQFTWVTITWFPEVGDLQSSDGFINLNVATYESNMKRIFFFYLGLRPIRIISLILSWVNRKMGQKWEIPEKKHLTTCKQNLACLICEKLNDPTVMSAFRATIGGRFAPLATLVDEDADLDSMVTHFNKAVTDTAAELLCKQRRKRKPWVTPEILDLCDQKTRPEEKERRARRSQRL